MKELIKDLYEREEQFNYEAVEKIRQNKGKINKYLIDEVKQMTKRIKEKDDYYPPLALDYCLYLLAEFKDKDAFPIIVDLFSIENIDYYDVVGMGITDKMYKFIASCFNGDYNLINSVIENKNIDEYVRGYFIESYSYFYINDLISKEELIKYIKDLIERIKQEDSCEEDYNYDFVSTVTLIMECHFLELINDVKILYMEDRVNTKIIGDFADFIDGIYNYSGKMEKVEVVDDIVKEMEWWACFKQSPKKNTSQKRISKMQASAIDNSLSKCNDKVGRNDPCPCGSGKKYKKCCLSKDEKNKVLELPYQNLLIESLKYYPKNDDSENGFYKVYKEEYIEIDKLMYKLIYHRRIPFYIKRDYQKEDLLDIDTSRKIIKLIQELCKKENINTIEEYDNKVSIHYDLEEFIDKYLTIITTTENIMISKQDEIEKLKEFLKETFIDYKELYESKNNIIIKQN